jgi:uncharacterized membrane protein YkgB
MVVSFLFFGYQKWFDYEANALLPYIGHGALSSFGCTQSLAFRGQPISSKLKSGFGALLFAGYWNKRSEILGAVGSCFSFIART